MLQFITGLTAATAHVLSGPDHLAAVTPLAIESKKRSWGIGMAWGIGHTLGILIIGVLFIMFRDLIPVEAISEHSEQLVGIMLILIGIWTILKIHLKIFPKKHAHPHIHDNEKGEFIHIHTHNHDLGHTHSEDEAHLHVHNKNYRQNIRAALAVGIFHGVAGVSHLFAILPTLALPTKLDAAMYLTGFGIGTIGAMVIFSAILGFVAIKTSESKRAKAYTILRVAGGSVAIIVGMWWILSTV
nr:sulfite exporter TauE/SafE family protein [Bacteroidota bacterium]